MDTTLLTHPLPMLLEALMLVCFGIAWPLANLRMLRSGRPEGKGLVFTLVILLGYAAGAGAKLLHLAAGRPLEPVFWLYALNASSVSLNLFLQWHLARRQARTAAAHRAGSARPGH